MTPELREQRLRLGMDVAARYIDRPSVLGVYLAGSVAAGLGTPGSDVDVMVVLAGEAPPFWAADQLRAEGIRVDVEFVSVGRIAELGSLGDPFDLSTQNSRPWWLSDGLDDAIRMLTSVDVKPADCVLRARQNLLEHQVELRRRVIAYHCAQYAQSVEDLWGFAADGDWESCLTVSAPCAEAGVAALLAACDQLYLGRKWIWRKLERCGAPSDVVLGCRELLGGPPQAGASPGSRPVRDFVVGRLNAAQRLLATALRHGWSARPFEGFPVSLLAGRPQPTGLNPWLTPSRMTDAILLLDVDARATKTSLPGLGLWCGYDRRLGDEAVLAAFLAESGGAISAATARAYLGKLMAAGMISPDRDWSQVGS